MKMRIKGDSLRLRISTIEMSTLLQSGRIEETIHFGPNPDAMLTYALITTEDSAHDAPLTVSYLSREIVVTIAAAQTRAWAEGTEVGLYGNINIAGGQLRIAVEKDFACLDERAEKNPDAFPNPNRNVPC